MDLKKDENGMLYCEWSIREKAVQLRRYFFQGTYRNPDSTHLVITSKSNIPKPGDNMYDYNGRYFRILKIIEIRDHKGFYTDEENREKIVKVRVVPIRYEGEQLAIKKQETE